MKTPPWVLPIELSGRERVPALKVFEGKGVWFVFLDDWVPGGELPRVVSFPRDQDARDFVARVKSGLSADEAIEIFHKGTH